MAEKKKGFRAGLYAVIVGLVLAVVLTALTVFAFTTRYTGFKADKVAQQYVDTIVQTGAGYNAYKNTRVSKNQKYGNFVINAYMLPYINEEAEQAAFVGTGSEEEQKAIDTVYATMYSYYLQLLNTYGMDDYDSVFNNYFKKLSEVRKEVYHDDFMNTEYMFGAFEANVETYGKSLTGVKAQKAEEGKAEVKEQIGEYQNMFGKDYKLTTTVKSCKTLSAEETKEYIAQYKERITPLAESGAAKAELLGVKDVPYVKKILFIKQEKVHEYPKDMAEAFSKLDCSDEISEVALAEVEVKDQKDNVVATQKVYVVKIDSGWYVDNTNVNTTSLYLAK